MLVLGIETTCDETAASVVTDNDVILSNIIYSQTDLHKQYGGVFPELASRKHIEVIIPAIDEALNVAKTTLDKIDLIAVSYAPGLIGALLIGLNCAKSLSIAKNIPFIGINHIEAHLYSAMMGMDKIFPSLGVILSGGHTQIVKINSIGQYELISQTIDDAIGEAFDKVASMLELSYPGGPEIEKIALNGDPNRFDFKAGIVKNSPLDFSFSGLKTKVLYTLKGQSSNKKSPIKIKEEDKKHIAAAFQSAIFNDIIKKIEKAVKITNARAVYLGGGVTQSLALREMIKDRNFPIPFFWPSKNLSLDNAAMIAGLGYQKFKLTKISSPLNLRPLPRVAFSP
jgi:tRNA N6-adenosine threonylcarbamoyltransferase